jgi:hypothetical protein
MSKVWPYQYGCKNTTNNTDALCIHDELNSLSNWSVVDATMIILIFGIRLVDILIAACMILMIILVWNIMSMDQLDDANKLSSDVLHVEIWLYLRLACAEKEKKVMERMGMGCHLKLGRTEDRHAGLTFDTCSHRGI